LHNPDPRDLIGEGEFAAMNQFRGRMPTSLALTLGIALGWVLANHRPPIVKAGGGDRYGDYSLTTGPVAIEYNSLTKTQAQKDALYFLDYRGARLLATVPTQRESMAGAQLIDGFIERDLAADFKIDREQGAAPHFLMTPGSLGAYGEGWSPLFVFETTTKQVAAYKIQMQTVGTKSNSRFVLLELKSYAALPALPGAAN
jgi:hypothetical protein